MFDTSTPLETPLHATIDHPKIPKQKVGVLVSNLGTPDNYDYWSMRRYLNEFLSDRRVIDYSPFPVAAVVTVANSYLKAF